MSTVNCQLSIVNSAKPLNNNLSLCRAGQAFLFQKNPHGPGGSCGFGLYCLAIQRGCPEAGAGHVMDGVADDSADVLVVVGGAGFVTGLEVE